MLFNILQKINREKSQLSGIHVFGFDIEILQQERVKKSKENFSDNQIDKRKRPLNEVSVSQQFKRFASFGQDAHQKINELILQYQMVSESGESIRLCNIELENNNQNVNLKYHSSINTMKLDTFVRAHDEALLGRDGYRKLAAIEPRLIREYQIAQRRVEISKLINNQIHIGTFNFDEKLNQQTIIEENDFYDNSDGILVDEQEIGQGAYRSIRTLLQILIPIWKKSNPPILQLGDTINLKLGGDGRNVGRKQNHVMMTVCLLNEKDEVLKPNNQYW